MKRTEKCSLIPMLSSGKKKKKEKKWEKKEFKSCTSANVQELPVSAFMWFKAIYQSAKTLL